MCVLTFSLIFDKKGWRSVSEFLPPPMRYPNDLDNKHLVTFSEAITLLS